MIKKASTRHRMHFSENEIRALRDYVKNNNAPFADIYLSTGVSRITVLKTLERGWAEVLPAKKIKKFLKQHDTRNNRKANEVGREA
mgnify:CR=1 FL=1